MKKSNKNRLNFFTKSTRNDSSNQYKGASKSLHYADTEHKSRSL